MIIRHKKNDKNLQSKLLTYRNNTNQTSVAEAYGSN